MKKQPIRCGKLYTVRKDMCDRLTLSNVKEQDIREQIEQEYHEQIDALTTQNIEYVELCRKYEKEIEDLKRLLLTEKNM